MTNTDRTHRATWTYRNSEGGVVRHEGDAETLGEAEATVKRINDRWGYRGDFLGARVETVR